LGVSLSDFITQLTLQIWYHW